MMGRRKLMILLGLFLLFLCIPTTIVFAEDNSEPENPGVVGEQESILAQSVVWMLPYGDSLFINDPDGDIFIDWSSVDVNSTEAPVEGVLALNTICGAGGGLYPCIQEDLDTSELTPEELGLPEDIPPIGYHNDCDLAGNDCEKVENGVENGGTFYPTNSPTVVIIKAGNGQFFYVNSGIVCDPSTMGYCVIWNDDNSITVIRNASSPSIKEISNIQFWHTSYNPEPLPNIDNRCPNVAISPGQINMLGSKIYPEYAIVQSQDPNQDGVTLEWFISVDPTVITYEKWELIGYEFLACVEGVNEDDYSETLCQPGWHALVDEVWGCNDHEIVYREQLSDLTAIASLSLDSRVWISDDLAAVFPGATVKIPNWGLDAPTDCIWNGDTCMISFTGNFGLVDPGTYEIRLQGQTSGTIATPAREFDDKAGEFGVFFIDSSVLIN